MNHFWTIIAEIFDPSIVLIDSRYFLTSCQVIYMTLKASLIFSVISLIKGSAPPYGISNLYPKNESQIQVILSFNVPESWNKTL